MRIFSKKDLSKSLIAISEEEDPSFLVTRVTDARIRSTWYPSFSIMERVSLISSFPLKTCPMVSASAFINSLSLSSGFSIHVIIKEQGFYCQVLELPGMKITTSFSMRPHIYHPNYQFDLYE